MTCVRTRIMFLSFICLTEQFTVQLLKLESLHRCKKQPQFAFAVHNRNFTTMVATITSELCFILLERTNIRCLFLPLFHIKMYLTVKNLVKRYLDLSLIYDEPNGFRFWSRGASGKICCGSQRGLYENNKCSEVSCHGLKLK